MKGRLQTLTIFVAAILVLGGFLLTKKTNILPENPSPSQPGNGKNCVMLTCHGLDISCGQTIEDIVCTEIYEGGDRCRQFATCEMVGGSCQPKLSPKFLECKQCVEECNIYQGNHIKYFECENKC